MGEVLFFGYLSSQTAQRYFQGALPHEHRNLPNMICDTRLHDEYKAL